MQVLLSETCLKLDLTIRQTFRIVPSRHCQLAWSCVYEPHTHVWVAATVRLAGWWFNSLYVAIRVSIRVKHTCLSLFILPLTVPYCMLLCLLAYIMDIYELVPLNGNKQSTRDFSIITKWKVTSHRVILDLSNAVVCCVLLMVRIYADCLRQRESSCPPRANISIMIYYNRLITLQHEFVAITSRVLKSNDNNTTLKSVALSRLIIWTISTLWSTLRLACGE